MFKDVLCVIPARGGSKGILDKNLVELGGMPLFMHSVWQAIKSGIPQSQIVVSSNDDRILKLADSLKVVSRRRPEELCGAASITEECLIDAYCHVPQVQHCSCILTLQPTSPMRASGRIAHALTTYFSGEYDSLLSVTKLYDFMWYENNINNEFTWESTYDPKQRPMRQSLGREGLRYFDNGSIFISNIQMLLDTHCRVGDRVCIYPISELEGMQIDDSHDLCVFRRIFKMPLPLRLDGINPDEVDSNGENM